MPDFGWKTDMEYSSDGVIRLHGHDIGFLMYRGWNANKPESPKRIYLVFTERDKYGLVKPYRIRDYHTRKLIKLQMVFPDSIELIEAFCKFCLEYAEYLEEQYLTESFQFLFDNVETGVVA